uniref:Uncharacterized protein n=1 Tax=Escherichia coli TaxID=562 RepID=A0A6G9HIN1_ECOLX|nr:hypothetical protein [Escherichia coli]
MGQCEHFGRQSESGVQQKEVIGLEDLPPPPPEVNVVL